MMGCPAPDDIDAYLAGRAPQVEAHLDECARCRKLVGELAKQSVGTAETQAGQNSTDQSLDTVPDRGDRPSRPSGAIPQRIGRFIIEKKLGSGGMGVVFLAQDPELKRKVVIKLLRSELLETSLADRARLLREAQAMAKVSHPNVVPIYDVGVHEERVFLAMEYIDGQDLAGWLEAPRGVAEVLAVFVAAGRGLAAAHRAGLVHRDFKPHNVMLGNGGEVKVTDFGLARSDAIEAVAREAVDRKKPRVRGSGPIDAATLLESPITHTGALVGTPAYMAPEQILVEAVDARTDQFSFCVALYEGLYGKRPFRGATVDELFESTLDGKLEVDFKRGVPGRVRAAIRRGLSTDPANRFPSMDALLAELAPRHTNRFVIGSVAVFAIAGVGAVFAFKKDDKVCTGASAEIATVWNPARQKKLETAFVALDAKFGPRAARDLAAKVDKYAGVWIANHQDACGDTRIRGEQTDANMERRMSCLRRRRAELDATLDVLATADAQLLPNASAMIVQLASPDTCANPDGLAQTITDPKLRADVDEVNKLIAKADALATAARFDNAGEVMREVVSRAEKLGHTPLLADAYLEAGMLAEARVDWPSATQWYDKAVEAAEKAGLDRQRVQAYTHQIEVARANGKLDDAERLARQAGSAIERLGDKELAAWLDRMVAEVQRARGQNEAAVKTYQRALARMTELKGANSREVAIIEQEFAMHLNANGDREQGYALLEKARDAYRAADPDGIDWAAVVGQLAEQRYEQDRFDEAVKLGEQMLDAYKAYFGDGHPMVIGEYPLHSLRLQGAGKNAEAEALMKHAVEVETERYGDDNAELGTTLTLLGLLQHKLGKDDDAYASFQKAVDTFTKAYKTDAHVDIVSTINAQGIVRKAQKRYPEALALFERSLALLAKFEDPNSVLTGDTLTKVGLTQVLAGKPDDGVKTLERALETRVAGKAGPGETSWTKLELAKALVAAKRDKARAIALAKEALADAQAAGDQGEVDDATAWLKATDASRPK